MMTAAERLREPDRSAELRSRQGFALAAIAAALLSSGTPRTAQAFLPADRWNETASGPTGVRGDSIMLTWSLVPDGTEIPGRSPSSLIAMLDDAFVDSGSDGADGGDLTRRPWFPIVESAFGRWSELGGVEFRYEPSDDGAKHRDSPGELGVRGDVRLAAAVGDGPGGTLAGSQFPDSGDLVLDADEGRAFGQPKDDFRRLRNTLMHEIGHVLGLEHVTSGDADILMEPALQLGFDGPQLDDVRGLHHLYGDRLERTHDGAGNDQLRLATPLGELVAGESLVLGGDAATDAIAGPTAIDFLSVTRRSDRDYFQFTVAAPALFEADLIPRGGSYRQAAVGETELLGNATASSDLSLALYAADAALLATADDQPRGETESLVDFRLLAAGDYYLGVSGTSDVVQLYELRLRLTATMAPEPGGATLAGGILGIALLFVQQRRHNGGPRARLDQGAVHACLTRGSGAGGARRD